MVRSTGPAGLVSSERIVLSAAIALALLALACTVWGCRGRRLLKGGSASPGAGPGPVGRSASGLAFAPWIGSRGGAFEGFAGSGGGGSGDAASDPASPASASPASVVASPGVVVPPLVLKDRSNEAGTKASMNLEERILRDGRNEGRKDTSGEGRLR